MKMEVSGFPHQVGGHFGLLSIPGHVCKPLNQREYDFYTQIDPRLAPFTAKLCSRIKVQCSSQPGEDGCLVMSTETLVECHRLNSGSQPSAGSKLASTASIQPSSLSASSSSSLSGGASSRQQQPAMTFRVKSGRVEAEKSVGNLWAGQCQSKVVQKLLKGHDRSFMLLEDLVANFARPCVVDLKMGTRQYGDDADAQKRLTQTQKCRHSTSSVFGVRLVGMQLYDAENEEYIFVNKYEGRRMDRIQFHDSLLQFFKLAGKPRTRQLIDELLSLRQVLVGADSFRFFSSSLLIAFDGEEGGVKRGECGGIIVKMIDFAHSTFNGFLEDKPYTGIDEGYLLGIDSLINFLTIFLQSGFKPLGAATHTFPPLLEMTGKQQQQRMPLKRKLENNNNLAAATDSYNMLAATTAALLGAGRHHDEDGEEESSINSSVGFTSDSGTEMGEPEEFSLLGAEDAQQPMQQLVNNVLCIPRAAMEEGNNGGGNSGGICPAATSSCCSVEGAASDEGTAAAAETTVVIA